MKNSQFLKGMAACLAFGALLLAMGISNGVLSVGAPQSHEVAELTPP